MNERDMIGRRTDGARRYKGATEPALNVGGAIAAWNAWADELARTMRAAITDSRVAVAEIARATGLSEATIHRMTRARGGVRRHGRTVVSTAKLRNIYLVARAIGLPIASVLPEGDR